MNNYIQTLFLTLLLSTSWISAKEPESIFHLGIEKGFVANRWDDHPDEFEKGDLDTPTLSIKFGGKFSAKITDHKFGVQISYIDSDSKIVDHSYEVLINIKSLNLRLGNGVELTGDITSRDSKYRDSQFDAFKYGVYFKGEYDLSFNKFYLSLHFRKTENTTLAQMEGVETKIAHEFDDVTKLGVTSKLGFINVWAELARFSFGITSIASKEFLYRIDSDNAYRFGIGAGVILTDFDIWVRGYMFNDYDDQTAIYYQAPHFTPDYTLSKSSIFAELLWKI